jgi:single-strand selective monofunctional uracil DNA glycosylase
VEFIAGNLVKAAKTLRAAVQHLTFGPPVTHVYNPLDYAWNAHELYLRKYGFNRKRVVFLGMNPGPFGMAQTGIPFGEIAAVRDWLKIQEPIRKPESEHPKRPVLGFHCRRSEVSGRRLWGLFAKRFKSAEHFFSEQFVVNYCPLIFFELSGCNRTPNQLPKAELTALSAPCDSHLRQVIEVLDPEWVVGIGHFAEHRARAALPAGSLKIGRILHPSPASPSANRDWESAATAQLRLQGIWK